MHSYILYHNLNWQFNLKLLIEDGEIYATINQKDGMVRFLEDPKQYKNCEMIEHIDSSIRMYSSWDFKLLFMS